MLVKIIHPYSKGGIFNQTPAASRLWGNVEFIMDGIDNKRLQTDECDILIVINFAPEKIYIKAREAWIIHQEPPNFQHFGHWTKYYKYFDKVFGPWQKDFKKTENFPEHGALFWFLFEGYDFYKNLAHSERNDKAVWITSSKVNFEGHKMRMKLKKTLECMPEIKIYGRGIKEIPNKKDILLKNKYALAIENTSTNFYFTEKITDAFLTWNLPFYWGAKNIRDYFPKNSFIPIDITKPQETAEIIKEAIENDLWSKNIENIKEAREIVLNRHQFFPYITEKIERFDIKNKSLKNMIIPKMPEKPELIQRLINVATRTF